jgi:hypothetical protein
MTFITDHTSIDLGHNRFMETYVEQLVSSEDDYESVIHALRVTGKLYADMIQNAFDQVDSPSEIVVSSDEARFAPPDLRLTS